MKWLFYLVNFCLFTRLEEIVDRKNGKEWYDSDHTQVYDTWEAAALFISNLK